MPTYEYNCPKCKAQVEVEASMSEVRDMEVLCPSCAEPTPMKRVFHPLGIKWGTSGGTGAGRKSR